MHQVSFEGLLVFCLQCCGCLNRVSEPWKKEKKKKKKGGVGVEEGDRASLAGIIPLSQSV